MKITVIVPTYKPQTYLWECLDSIYNQTFSKSDYELILVLNGCNEPYNSQIKDWLSEHKDLQVQFIQTNQGGVSNARNIAIDNARGKYVTFIDDDDLISISYLKELYEKATPDTVSLCYPYAFNDGDLGKQLPYRITDAYDYCVKNKCTKISSKVRKFFSGPCMKLIPFSFIQNRRFDKRFKNGEDTLFMFLISDRINNIAFTSKNAIYYRRIRVGSASNQERVFKTILTSQMLLTKEYLKIYMTNIPKYNFSFFLTRMMGAIYSVLIKK